MHIRLESSANVPHNSSSSWSSEVATAEDFRRSKMDSVESPDVQRTWCGFILERGRNEVI